MKINALKSVLLFSFLTLLGPSAILAENIQLMKRDGVYQLPVEVNGVITRNFVLDTGAAEVNIPADVALTLYRAGTIQKSDFLPGQTYTLADGSPLNSARFLLRNLTIGRHRIGKVPASIGAVSSPLLLGQNFLERLGTWGIDNQKQVLTIGTREKRAQREASTSRPATSAALSGAYQTALQAKIRHAWHIPPQSQGLQASVLLIVNRAGQVEQFRVVHGSGNAVFDASLQRAITQAQPLPALPEDFTSRTLDVMLTFRDSS
jgi:TonB family protein